MQTSTPIQDMEIKTLLIKPKLVFTLHLGNCVKAVYTELHGRVILLLFFK